MTFLDKLLWTLLDPHFAITLCLIINMLMHLLWASLVAQLVKNPPAIQETWVQYLGWEDPLEEGMPTQCWHSPVFLSGESLRTEEPGGLKSMGSQRVRHG